jgi:DNA-binding transcriptional MerR regulator
MRAVGGTPSSREYLSIKDVLDVLAEEFPDITISKIRFLESRGLIHPERTPSGYRKFFDADIERLRWILRQQREHFLPLKVIKGRLERELGGPVEPSLFDDDLDAAEAAPAEPSGVPASARPVTVARAEPPMPPQEQAPVVAQPTAALPSELAAVAPPEPVAAEALAAEAAPAPAGRRSPRAPLATSGVALGTGELAGASGAAPGLIAELEEYGLIEAVVVGGTRTYADNALAVACLAARFAEAGVEPRHLAVLRRAAEREGELFANAVGPLLRQRNPAARAQAHDQLEELIELGGAFATIFVRAGARRNLPS